MDRGADGGRWGAARRQGSWVTKARGKSVLVVGVVILWIGFALERVIGHRRAVARLEAAAVAAARAQLRLVLSAMDDFAADCGSLPDPEKGLTELVSCPEVPAWDGPYLVPSRVPLDPWRTPYRYQAVAGRPVLLSAGPDTAFGTADDIRDQSDPAE